MPLISTDDAARSLRQVWLGPTGFRFPFDARFTAWGTALAFIFAGAAFGWPLIPHVLYFPYLLVVVGASIWATRRVMRAVDHDRPLRYRVAQLRVELTAPRPGDDVVVYETSLSPALFHDAPQTGGTP